MEIAVVSPAPQQNSAVVQHDKKTLMLSSLFPKYAIPLSKRRHKCCAAPKNKVENLK